jgi:hypothetical protein
MFNFPILDQILALANHLQGWFLCVEFVYYVTVHNTRLRTSLSFRNMQNGRLTIRLKHMKWKLKRWAVCVCCKWSRSAAWEEGSNNENVWMLMEKLYCTFKLFKKCLCLMEITLILFTKMYFHMNRFLYILYYISG